MATIKKLPETFTIADTSYNLTSTADLVKLVREHGASIPTAAALIAMADVATSSGMPLDVLADNFKAQALIIVNNASKPDHRGALLAVKVKFDAALTLPVGEHTMAHLIAYHDTLTRKINDTIKAYGNEHNVKLTMYGTSGGHEASRETAKRSWDELARMLQAADIRQIVTTVTEDTKVTWLLEYPADGVHVDASTVRVKYTGKPIMTYTKKSKDGKVTSEESKYVKDERLLPLGLFRSAIGELSWAHGKPPIHAWLTSRIVIDGKVWTLGEWYDEYAQQDGAQQDGSTDDDQQDGTDDQPVETQQDEPKDEPKVKAPSKRKQAAA